MNPAITAMSSAISQWGGAGSMQSMMNPMGAGGQGLSGLVGASAGPASSLGGSQATAPTPFSDLLTDAVGQVSKLEDQAHDAVTGLMSGSGVDVHTAMIATQKASMSFELALSVRNKAVAAYQQVVGMQF
jgi:flagellar hook-basal body complex protein FliE